MGMMFRSEKMALCQLFVQPETAYHFITFLGEAGIAQFKDLNSEVNAFNRNFVSEVRRCDEIERKLCYIEAEILKEHVTIPECTDNVLAPNPREIIDLEAQLDKYEREIIESCYNTVTLKSNNLELTEFKHLLEKTHTFFQEQVLTRTLLADDSQQVCCGSLQFVAGVVPRERVPAFQRMLWRISRGNVFFQQTALEKPLEDPNTGNLIWKTVFVTFFQSEQLKTIIKKVCSGFHATLYPCPSSFAKRQDKINEVRVQLEDFNLLLNQTKDHRQKLFVSGARELRKWSIMVRKMKAVYHTLNLFNMDITKKCLIGECWVPVKDLTFVQKALYDGNNAVGSSIPSFLNVIETSEDPPTFNNTNYFTQGFQTLIDSYGIASYREVNPALYTIITFPFLFAIMFGDVGHGLILTIFGAYLVICEEHLMKKKTNNEIWNIFFGGRYIILLMGVFSIYTGLIYNDVFSKMLNIFGSSWSNITYPVEKLMENKDLTLDPRFEYIQKPYPFGLDPVWQTAANKIVFLNSYKMKLSIIFGVMHMMFGVTLSAINHVHFRKPINILLEYLPQMIFLTLMFFYMVAMMFIKWVVYAPRNELKTSPHCAPSVLIIFINMILFKPGSPLEGCDEFMFPYQPEVQRAFVLISLLCIPVMFLGKPIYLLCCGGLKKYKKLSLNDNQQSANNLLDESTSSTVLEPEGGEEQPVEIFIQQAIHTVEYVLSTISHSASYLRLWALSLAHAQLSEVLWDMVLRKGLVMETHLGPFSLYLAFAAWATFTIAILVLMEGLSAFLHTLRLHWVEFMSKFYVGSGYLFRPFSFKLILESAQNVDD